MCRDLLAGVGYHVTAHACPGLGLAGVAALTADAILLNFLFGHENIGLAFLRRLKTARATAAIWAVVHTSDRRAQRTAVMLTTRALAW